jgi:hypothetical protein
LCGLIAADGHLESNGCIALAQKDRRFIDWLVEFVRNSNIKISSVFFDRSVGVWKIEMRDKDFYSYLLSNGVRTGKKSYLLKPPIRCDPLWYIVGFIDGDGWIEQVKKKANGKTYYYLRIGIKTKSRELRDWMRQVLHSLGIITSKADKKDGYEIHINRNAWIVALYLQNPAHKERLSRIEDDRIKVSSYLMNRIFTYAFLPTRDHGRETPGLHAGYNGGDSGIRTRKGEAIPQTPP